MDKNEARLIRDEVNKVRTKQIEPTAIDAVVYIAWCAKLLAALEDTERQRRHWWFVATRTDPKSPRPLRNN